MRAAGAAVLAVAEGVAALRAEARVLRLRGGRGTASVEEGWDWQQPPSAPRPPQQPPADWDWDWEREAARLLQKRVLLGSAWHCAQVPGPLTQGLAVDGMVGGTEEEDMETSPSDGGGVNADRRGRRDEDGMCDGCGREVERAASCSAAISAQMQGVPSEQKPQGSATVAEVGDV